MYSHGLHPSFVHLFVAVSRGKEALPVRYHKNCTKGRVFREVVVVAIGTFFWQCIKTKRLF